MQCLHGNGAFTLRNALLQHTQALDIDMTQTPAPTTTQTNQDDGMVARFLKATELDTRLIGMVGALGLIWVGFHLYGRW